MSEPLAQSSFLDDPPHRKGERLVPAGARLDYCRSCGAAIVWWHPPRGPSFPLSAATIIWRDSERYALSHFVDCPDAEAWRSE